MFVCVEPGSGLGSREARGESSMTRGVDVEDDGGKWCEMSMFRLVEMVFDGSVVFGSLESCMWRLTGGGHVWRS